MDLGAPAAFAMDLAAHARFQCLRMDQRRVCYDLTADPERCQSWRQWLHDQYPELAREVSELERWRRDGEPEEPKKPKLTIVNLISDDEIHIEDGTLTDTADTEEDPDTVRAPPEPPSCSQTVPEALLVTWPKDVEQATNDLKQYAKEFESKDFEIPATLVHKMNEAMAAN